jgi:hypothetical protein
MAIQEGKALSFTAVPANYAAGVLEGDTTPVYITTPNGGTVGQLDTVEWVGTIAQAGVADPTVASVIRNTLSVALPVAARTGVGVYTFTFTGAGWTAGTTTVLISGTGTTALTLTATVTASNVITVRAFDGAGAAADVITAMLYIKKYLL